MIGKEICFNRKPGFLLRGTRDARFTFGGGLIRGSPRVVRNCRDGKMRKVIAQVMQLTDHRSYKKNAFHKTKHYWRTFRRSSGWTSKPLPADRKKADIALLNFAEKGYQSMIIYNFGMANSRVRLNKKDIQLEPWSRNQNNGPTKGSFIRRGLSDPTERHRKSLHKRLRNCNKKLRAARSASASPARSASASPAMGQRVPVQQSGGGDAW